MLATKETERTETMEGKRTLCGEDNGRRTHNAQRTRNRSEQFAAPCPHGGGTVRARNSVVLGRQWRNGDGS